MIQGFHVWPIIRLFDVIYLSNFMLTSILMCILYCKLKGCMEHQLMANNHLSGQSIYRNVHVHIIFNGTNIIQSGSTKIDIFYVMINNSSNIVTHCIPAFSPEYFNSLTVVITYCSCCLQKIIYDNQNITSLHIWYCPTTCFNTGK